MIEGLDRHEAPVRRKAASSRVTFSDAAPQRGQLARHRHPSPFAACPPSRISAQSVSYLATHATALQEQLTESSFHESDAQPRLDSGTVRLMRLRSPASCCVPCFVNLEILALRQPRTPRPSLGQATRYLCLPEQVLHTTGTVHDGNALRYRASKFDCDVCALKMQCCPNMLHDKSPETSMRM